MSVSHFSFGVFAWKSRLIRFSGAGLISPKYEPKRRRHGLAATRRSCFINRCKTFSKIVTLDLRVVATDVIAVFPRRVWVADWLRR